MKKVKIVSIVMSLFVIIFGFLVSCSPVVKEKEVVKIKKPIVQYSLDFIKNNPTLFNNTTTTDQFNVIFKDSLILNIESLILKDEFELKYVLKNGKKIYVVLGLTTNFRLDDNFNQYWMSIVGCLSDSVDVSTLVEGKRYTIKSGDFTKFIKYRDVESLTGYSVMLDTEEIGFEKESPGPGNSVKLGTSLWKDLNLK